MTRNEAVRFLLYHPSRFGRLLGFTKLTNLHNGWIRKMVKGAGDHTLQAHRGSYKTTCVSIALAEIMILLPNKRTLFMRKTDSDVKEVIKQVQKILTDPHTQYLVNVIYGVNLKLQSASATELTTNLTTDIRGTAQLVGIGTGASLTGKHFDFIFTDDIVNINDRISAAERNRTKLIYQELQNIKNRGGRILNTGTPWHKDDCFSIMPDAEKWDVYSTGLVTEEEANEIKEKMVPSLFAANYLLKHIASEDVIFDSPVLGADPALVEQGDDHIDAAYGGADFTAYTAMNRHDGKYYVYGRLWHKAIDDVVDECAELHRRFMCGRIHVEDNGDKGYLAKDLRAKGLRVHKYHENTNKYLKITSFLKFAWREVVFVTGTDQAYIDQILDYNENAEHDDAPDSCASLIRAVDRRGNDEYTPVWG